MKYVLNRKTTFSSCAIGKKEGKVHRRLVTIGREALRETSKWRKKELFGSFIIFLLVACAQALVYLQIFVRPLQSHCAVESY